MQYSEKLKLRINETNNLYLIYEFQNKLKVLRTQCYNDVFVAFKIITNFSSVFQVGFRLLSKYNEAHIIGDYYTFSKLSE